MHMHGEPMTMQRSPMEGDAVPQVREFLHGRSEALRARGVSVSRIAWDPGIGFGKTVGQNFALLARQRELLHEGYPLLAGWSRKSSLGSVTGAAMGERLVPSVAAALLAVDKGASIVRVHDVKETVAALKVWGAAQAAQGGQAGSIT
jgi:dihydropteroate synthase